MSADTTPLEAAAAWYLRLGSAEATPADRAGWQAWHDGAAEHRAAWARVERLQSLLAQAPGQAAKALRGASASGAVRRRRLLTGLGLLAAVAVLPLALPLLQPVPTDWISTAPGERREVQLSDGSRLLVGAASRVGIRYGRRTREIVLESGALSLVTGRDAQDRPLSIVARDGVLRPLGTRFTLQQGDSASLLAVQEHAVELSGAPGGEPAIVRAGERLRFSRTSVGRPEPAGFADTAWTQGILAVVEMPLAQFLAALRREAGIEASCEPNLAAVAVSGTYRVDQPELSLKALAELQGLRLERRGKTWYLRTR